MKFKLLQVLAFYRQLRVPSHTRRLACVSIRVKKHCRLFKTLFDIRKGGGAAILVAMATVHCVVNFEAQHTALIVSDLRAACAGQTFDFAQLLVQQRETSVLGCVCETVTHHKLTEVLKRKEFR